MNNIKAILSADRARYDSRPNLKDWLLKNESWFIFHYIRHMRYTEYYKNKGLCFKPLYLWHFVVYKRLGFKLGFSIHPGSVGPGFRIYHSGSFTHVGPNVSIGKNCTMMPGVVFGNKTETPDMSPVKVGDNCYFGLSVRVLGPVTIGNNVTVGANAVVTKDIPDNAVVVGIPARVLKFKSGSDE